MRVKTILTLLTLMILILPSVYSTGNCVIKGGISISSADEFGLGEDITAKVILYLATGDNTGQSVTLFLKDGETIIAQSTKTTDSSGIAEFTFSGIQKGGTRTLYAKFEDLTDTKTISIKPKLKLSMSVPTTNFVGMPILINLRVIDAETSSVITADKFSPIIITKGTEQIPYPSIDISKPIITISKEYINSIGTISIEVTVNKAGYISDTETATIEVQLATTQIEFKVDGKDPIEFSTTGIGTGNKKITLKASEANQVLEIGEIDISIQNPSGETQKLSFHKKPDNSYESSYNFLQESNVYYIDGSIQIFGEGREPISLKGYEVTTTKKDIEVLPFQLSWWVIIIAVGFIAMLVVVYFIFRRRKK